MKTLLVANGVLSKFSTLNLRWKIYFSLTAILVPVFALTYFIQSQLTRPLLEEEIRQIGISVCRAVSTDIMAYRLFKDTEQLEARLIETTWLQPSVVRIEVYKKNKNSLILVGSNITGEVLTERSSLEFKDNPTSQLKQDDERKFWDITFPIKKGKRTYGYIRAEVSLQLADQVVHSFSKINFLGAILGIVLLILLLSFFLRKMIENERKLKKAEYKNIELNQQLDDIQRQLFLNEKLAIVGQLTASFAHEIGTPLSSLSGHLQLLHEETQNTSSKNRIEIIESQVTRIEKTVKEFLTSTHSPVQHKQLVNIKECIERLVKLVAPRAKALQCELLVDISQSIFPIRMVPTDIEQVMLNLINNALDALQKKNDSIKWIQLKANVRQYQQNKSLEITVSDSGEGIEPNAMKQIMKPFFTTKAPGQGTGLGLTISQRLVKKYGGSLAFDSVVGKGTTIKVNIPYDAA